MAKGMILANDVFVWNAASHVGPGCQNALADVQLVQLGYAALAANPKSGAPPEDKPVYSAVVVGSTYTGAANDPLTLAIKRHQQRRGGTQDGRVSPIQSTSGVYDAAHTWILVVLSNNIKDVLGANWPHLDRHPKCPPALAAVSKKAFAP